MTAPEASFARGGAALLAVLLLAAGARAGTVAPSAAAAAQGGLGLRVTLGPACAVDEKVVAGPSVDADQAACRTVRADAVTVVAPGAVFSAGRDVVLGEGFAVAPGVSFTAAVDPLLPSDFAWVWDDAPAAESSYQALFDVRVDDLAWSDGDEIGHLVGHAADETVVFRVALRWNSALGETRLKLAARDEVTGGLREHPAELPLGPGFNTVQIAWRAGAGDGELVASVNGAPYAGIVDLANAAARLESVRWGAVDGTLTGTSGWLDVDDFLSWR